MSPLFCPWKISNYPSTSKVFGREFPMTIKNYAANAVSSFVDYINDIKPFHCKLSEIVEEYDFSDAMVVAIGEQSHFLKNKTSGVWAYNSYSDGFSSDSFLLPEFSQIGNSRLIKNQSSVNLTKIASTLRGFPTSSFTPYHIGHHSGIIGISNSDVLCNGLDYFVTYGSNTFTLDSANKRVADTILVERGSPNWKTTKISYPSQILFSDNSKFLNTVSFDTSAPVTETFTVTCTNTSSILGNKEFSVTNQSSFSTPYSFGDDKWVVLCLDDSGIFIEPTSVIFDGFFQNVTITFSENFTGTVKFMRVISDYASIFKQTTASSSWVFSYTGGVNNVVPMVRIKNGDGSFKYIKNPNITVSSSQVTVNFSSPVVGEIFLLKVPQNGSNTSVSVSSVVSAPMPHTKSIAGVWASNGSWVAISSSVANVGTFSSSVSGTFVACGRFTVGSKLAQFSATGGVSGAFYTFDEYSPIILNGATFRVDSSNWQPFVLGSSADIKPQGLFTSNPNATSTGTYTITRVEPKVLESRPVFGYSGFPVIQNFVANNVTADSFLTVTFVSGTTFSVTNSIGQNLGSVNVGGVFSNSDYSFSLSSSNTRGLVAGDKFVIVITKVSPTISNFYVGVGYDVLAYDVTGYSGEYFPTIQTASQMSQALSFVFLGAGLQDGSMLELKKTGTSTFSVILYSDSSKNTQLDSYGVATVGSQFSSSLFTLTVPTTFNGLAVGEVIDLTVKNPKYSVDAGSLKLKPVNGIGKMRFFSKSSYVCPKSSWVVTVNGDNSTFTVSSSLLSTTYQGVIGSAFDNGLVHFKISQNPQRVLKAGDSVRFSILDKKPYYLVTGGANSSEVAMADGDWFYDGALSFGTPIPSLKIVTNQAQTIFDKNEAVFPKTVSLSSSLSITINSPLLDYLGSDVYQFYFDGNRFNVSSKENGRRKDAIIGVRYLDDYYLDVSHGIINGYSDARLDLTINGTVPPIGFSFSLEIDSKIQMQAGDGFILTFPTVAKTGSLILEKALRERISFSKNSNNIPIYIDNPSPFPDNAEQLTLKTFDNNEVFGYVNGSLDNGEDISFAYDADFVANHLPLNTNTNVTVYQNGQENEKILVRICDFLFFSLRKKNKEDVTAHVVGTPKLQISGKRNESVIAHAYDGNFQGFSQNGYDQSPYDTQAYDLAVGVPSKQRFGAVWGQSPFKVVGTSIQSSGLVGSGGAGVYLMGKDRNTVSSNITDTLSISVLENLAGKDRNTAASNITDTLAISVLETKREIEAPTLVRERFEFFSRNVNDLTKIFQVFVTSLVEQLPSDPLYVPMMDGQPAAVFQIPTNTTTIRVPINSGISVNSITAFTSLAATTEITLTEISTATDVGMRVFTISAPSGGYLVLS